MAVIQQWNQFQTTTGRFKEKSYDGDYMKAGKIAEKISLDFLADHPDVIGVKDISEIEVIQTADADALIKLRQGTNPLAEFKSDAHMGITSNVLIEVLRINHRAPQESAGVLGWSLRTEVRWIFVFGPRTGYLYQFKTADLRRAFQNYTEQVRENTKLHWVSTDRVKSTLCVLMPLKYCHGTFQVHDVLHYARRYIEGIDKLRLRFAPEPLEF